MNSNTQGPIFIEPWSSFMPVSDADGHHRMALAYDLPMFRALSTECRPAAPYSVNLDASRIVWAIAWPMEGDLFYLRHGDDYYVDEPRGIVVLTESGENLVQRRRCRVSIQAFGVVVR